MAYDEDDAKQDFAHPEIFSDLVPIFIYTRLIRDLLSLYANIWNQESLS